MCLETQNNTIVDNYDRQRKGKLKWKSKKLRLLFKEN